MVSGLVYTYSIFTYLRTDYVLTYVHTYLLYLTYNLRYLTERSSNSWIAICPLSVRAGQWRHPYGTLQHLTYILTYVRRRRHKEYFT